MLRIQLLSDLIRHPFIDGIDISPAFCIKFGKPLPLGRERIEILTILIRNQLLLCDKLNDTAVNQALNLLFRLIQKLFLRQRPVQLDGGGGIVRRCNLIARKACPDLFTFDGHRCGKGVGKLVVGHDIGFVQAIAGLAVFQSIFRLLLISTVDVGAAIVHGLLEAVDILPSLFIVQRQVGGHKSPVVGIVHDQSRVGVVVVAFECVRFIGLRLTFQSPVKGQVQVGPVTAAGVLVFPGFVGSVAGGAGKGIGERELVGQGIRLRPRLRHNRCTLLGAIVGVGIIVAPGLGLGILQRRKQQGGVFCGAVFPLAGSCISGIPCIGGRCDGDFLHIISVGHTHFREQGEIFHSERPLGIRFQAPYGDNSRCIVQFTVGYCNAAVRAGDIRLPVPVQLELHRSWTVSGGIVFIFPLFFGLQGGLPRPGVGDGHIVALIPYHRGFILALGIGNTAGNRGKAFGSRRLQLGKRILGCLTAHPVLQYQIVGELRIFNCR